MSYRILLNANVYVQYAAYGKIEQLVSIIIDNGFSVFATNHLLHEVYEALLKPNILKSESITPANVISFLQKIVFMFSEKPTYQLSPDLDDNYLFDIALQTGC